MKKDWRDSTRTPTLQALQPTLGMSLPNQMVVLVPWNTDSRKLARGIRTSVFTRMHAPGKKSVHLRRRF